MNATACNACGQPLKPRFEKVVDPQSGEHFRIDACGACGLGHTLPQPEDLGRYYGAEYHGGRHGITAAYCAWRRVRFVHGVAGGARGRKLLDVGCGDGTFLQAAQGKDGWTPVGTEMNPSIARAAGLEVHETLEQAAANGPYGCVTLWHSLEHLRDPRAALEQIHTLLAPDGTVVISVPDAQGLQAKLFGAKWFHLDVPRHLFHFGEENLTALLGRCGFEVVKTWHQELELDLFGWTQSALNSVMKKPNVFFYHLTGRPTGSQPGQVATSYVLGSALTAAAFPLTALGTATGKGGTLVLAARPKASA